MNDNFEKNQDTNFESLDDSQLEHVSGGFNNRLARCSYQEMYDQLRSQGIPEDVLRRFVNSKMIECLNHVKTDTCPFLDLDNCSFYQYVKKLLEEKWRKEKGIPL